MRTAYAHKATWDGPPLDELAGAMIYNAPRPLYGHRAWPGPFLHGSFYAAVFDAQENAEFCRRQNEKLDASRVELVDNDDVKCLIEQQLTEAGYSLADYEEIGMGLREVAHERGLPWHEEDGSDD